MFYDRASVVIIMKKINCDELQKRDKGFDWRTKSKIENVQSYTENI